MLNRRIVRAALELLAGPNAARAGAVHVDVAGIVRIGHDGMRMGSAARLHGADLPRVAEVADVEDADAAETLLARRRADALQAAIQPAARLLDRHDQQIAGDRDVALPARTDDRAHELGRTPAADVVDVEAVIVAGDEHLAGEHEIGIGEVQQARPRLGFVVFFGATSLVAAGVFPELFELFRELGLVLEPRRLALHAPARGIARIEKAGRLRQRKNHIEISHGLARVAKSGLQRDPRIRRQAREHGVHALDFAALVGRDVGRELVEHGVLRGSGLLEQLLDHRQRPSVVRDHELEKQRVEIETSRIRELRQLLRGCHARHELLVVRGVCSTRGQLEVAIPQPVFHQRDLVFLRERNPLRE
jgi:hypothetical protein